MDHSLPRPPWLRRLPAAVWTASAWCAAGLFALVLFATTTYQFRTQSGSPVLVGLGLRVGLAVVLSLVVIGARRRPVTVFGVLLAESTVTLTLGESTWPFFVAADVLLCLIATTRRRRTSFVAATVELAVWLGQWAATDHGQAEFSDFLSTLLAVVAGIVIPFAIGNSIRQQRVYGEALRTHAAARAVTEERLRIARELHDMVAHSIGIIAIQAGAAGLVIDTQPEGARKALGIIESTSRETLAGLRRMLVSLRRAEADAESDQAVAVSTTGLEGVERLAATASAAGVRVDVDWLGVRRPVPPEIDLAAFRIIQESVTNAARHSGGRHCRVCVEYRDEELAIEVVDDGHGPARAAAGTGLGISGMRERVALLGGRFSAGAGPEGGFQVAARLPV
ncbi:sensor histidine kinase [Streptomyces sp. CBMA152]|uniref:sensor histidine kinase n=1 Tax=Streptomyces sp. CBMA152 TaxID=1896312 RepID=UPI001660A136|nr:sensor histidine kinase [Streptomyces sp. CBMA152]MBD0741135.1 histidine kinase [Streptomyces sp. CBMA152]